MPLKLPNGVVVFNTTPHPIDFWFSPESKVYTSMPDMIVNAYGDNSDVQRVSGYDVVRVSFKPTSLGQETLDNIKAQYPKAVVVGSIIAAIAYPEQVLMTVPYSGGRGKTNKHNRLYRYDRFTAFPKEK